VCVESSKKKEDTLNELIDKSIRKKTMFCTTGDSNTRPRGKGGASLDTKTTRAASPSCPSVTQIIYMVSFKLIEISTTKNFFPKILGGQLPPLAPMWLRLWLHIYSFIMQFRGNKPRIFDCFSRSYQNYHTLFMVSESGSA